jgi:Na+:H+ antiporter, NhaA family
VLFALNRANVQRFAPYLLVGIFVWVCVLKSGVHATLAGVAVALMVPLSGGREGEAGIADRLMHDLHPWTTFLVAPLFAFANAGVSLAGLSLSALAQPVPLGIAVGLFVGKIVGIFSAVWLMVRMGLADLPEGARWLHIFGVAALGGIGFTMSLFIGMLAFPDPAMAGPLRIGVLTGSILSAVVGYLVLKSAK